MIKKKNSEHLVILLNKISALNKKCYLSESLRNLIIYFISEWKSMLFKLSTPEVNNYCEVIISFESPVRYVN